MSQEALTKTITLSTDPLSVAVIRKLNWRRMREAGEKISQSQIDTVRRMGGEIFKVIRDSKTEDVADKVKAIQDSQRVNPDNYDMEVTLTYGVASIDGESADLETLDADTALTLHREIVAYSLERFTKNA